MLSGGESSSSAPPPIMSVGCVPALLRGLNVEMVEFRAGRDLVFGCGEPFSLIDGVSMSSCSSSATSRTRPNTLLTTFPIAISLGCAAVSLCPTCRICAMSLATSLPLKPSTRRIFTQAIDVLR